VDEEPVAQAETVSSEELIRLLSVLSHDLKSPIFSIDGFSELLLGDYYDRLDDEGKDFLRRIRSSVGQMKRVLDEMSRMVKLLSRPNASRPTPLREIVEEVLLKYNFQIEEGGVRVDVAAHLPTVNVDPEKMREALGALVSNALFFNDRPKGERRVVVEGTTEQNDVHIRVLDNGIGVDPRYLGQIFDLGLKLDKSRGGGPGYGLYLARRVAESHGGSLSAESQLDQGSAFSIHIPGEPLVTR
jgi:signal transduction histidine kinase